MTNPAEGQKANRQERSEQYQKWAGAAEMQADGSVKQATVSPAVIVDQEVNAIRQTLKSGVKVRLDISDEAIIKAIKGFLTPEELKNVTFGSEEPVSA